MKRFSELVLLILIAFVLYFIFGCTSKRPISKEEFYKRKYLHCERTLAFRTVQRDFWMRNYLMEIGADVGEAEYEEMEDEE